MIAGWQEIQERIWQCEACCEDPRVETNIRQQTEQPTVRTKVLVISLAPPFVEGVKEKTKAASATTSADDKLRLFLEGALRADWQTLTGSGVILLHTVKCAIVPVGGGFQNPPSKVVDRCAPVHLAAELRVARPTVVVTFGRMAYRAFCLASRQLGPGMSPAELKLSVPPKRAQPGEEGHPVDLLGQTAVLFASAFPRGRGRREAIEVVRRAVTAAGIVRT